VPRKSKHRLQASRQFQFLASVASNAIAGVPGPYQIDFGGLMEIAENLVWLGACFSTDVEQLDGLLKIVSWQSQRCLDSRLVKSACTSHSPIDRLTYMAK
jgi:hypothetical protein